jgi:hypothetical protein
VCYDVPGLPRTDNDLEHCSRQLTAGERRATGHRRSDTFLVRVGGFAAYAAAARPLSEAPVAAPVAAPWAAVPPAAYRAQRAARRATQHRQVQMHRFHLRPDRYLHDLEVRWSQLTDAP